MFPLFLALAILSLLAVIAGGAWILAGRGHTQKRSGPEVGAEIMSATMSATEDEGGMTLAEGTVFAGKAVAVSVEAEISYAEIKGYLRAGQIYAVLPVLIAMAGLLGLLVFGALALWLKLDSKWLGAAIAGVVLFTVGRIVVAFIRA
jgi:hypothetical protein